MGLHCCWEAENCQDPYRLEGACPLFCLSFSSVSFNSLQELQSKRPRSQTWKQYRWVWVGWMRKKNASRAGLPDGLATTWGWAVFNNFSDKLKSLAGFLVQLLGNISRHQSRWGNATQATSPPSLAKDPAPHSSSALQRGFELRCCWTPQSFAAFVPIASVTLSSFQIKTTLA